MWYNVPASFCGESNSTTIRTVTVDCVTRELVFQEWVQIAVTTIVVWQEAHKNNAIHRAEMCCVFLQWRSM